MENSYRFFENRACRYFPCHKGLKDFNCLFCYCPFYLKEKCPGAPQYIETEQKRIKDCTNCTFPHRPENYDAILRILRES
ncbi:MAG: metal-binding protein [Lachnospiraceae bacterium]|mgnify:FL=1|jgi:Zn-finger protein|nr:metal-binding protein [Lachnospiraceae bacterium]